MLALEASRLARNDRDWSQLVELGAITKIVLIDHDGIYDPRLVNDRLLLGLKGIMSDFEMATLRQRALEAQRTKAQRGELWMHLPVGLVYGPTGAIEPALVTRRACWKYSPRDQATECGPRN